MDDEGPIQIDENATEGHEDQKSEEYTDFEQTTEGMVTYFIILNTYMNTNMYKYFMRCFIPFSKNLF